MFAIHRYRGGFAGVAAAAVIIVIALAFWGYGAPAAGLPPTAHAQPAPVRPPPNQQARNTGEPGEVIVSWGTGTGANSYRVGWLNHNDYLAAGSDWLQRFTFANVPLRTREYKITRLTPGEEYWFIVASVDAQNRMYWPAQWIEKLTVTPAPTPTPMPTPTPCPTAGHGSGAPGGSGDGAMCPITGLPIGEGYKEIGDRKIWNGIGSLTVQSAQILEPGQHRFIISDEPYTIPNKPGRRFLKLTVFLNNFSPLEDWVLYPGFDFILDTDAGIAFNASGSRGAGPLAQGQTEMVFEIPENAETAILAAQPGYYTTDASRVAFNQPTLWRIPVPQ